ncbi:MAG TPA: hypothetical protein VFP56_01985 [Candidatus Limnocylindrales bacterium]|nr:hypothetical protein [Candidatus Limnocylindrales bacterium]
MEPSGVFSFSAARRTLIAALVASVAACQSPAATTGPGSPAPTTGGPSAPAATAEPSENPPGLFHVVGSAPVIARTTFPDRNAVLPGAVTTAADGTYHAWVIAFAAAPGTQEVHYLTSDDGVAWTEVGDASLEGLSEGFGNPGAMPTSVLEEAEGWTMYLVGTLASEQQGWDIWRATAPGPGGPWTRSDEPVLRRGAAGSWDAGGLDFPTVYPTATGYTMLYSGIEAPTTTGGAIGRATSEDGIAWTRGDGPVLEPGLCGGFDTRAVHQPRVLATAENLVMAYAGYAEPADSRAVVGYADSLDDGETWGCEWPWPGLDTTGLPDGFVHTIAAFQRGDRVALLVEWLSGDGTDVWLADLGLSAP